MHLKLCSTILIRVALVVLALLGHGSVRLLPFAHKYQSKIRQFYTLNITLFK